MRRPDKPEVSHRATVRALAGPILRDDWICRANAQIGQAEGMLACGHESEP